MKPEHTAWTSKAAPRLIPSRACTMVATEGKVSSGVVVATITMSSSLASMPASSSAARPAARAKSDVFSVSFTTRRSRMPVRSRIQASEVSTRLARSSLVSTVCGRWAPQPITRLRIMVLSFRHQGAEPGPFGGDAAVDVGLDHADRHVEGAGKAGGVGAAMALYHHTFEAQKNSSIGGAGIQPPAQRPQRTRRDQCAEAPQQRAFERTAQKLAHQLGGAFGRFEGDIAGEAVGDHD